MKNIILNETHMSISCYKQGYFWTSYEQSAYQIWKKKKYKVSFKYIKKINQTITSVSFPETALVELIKHFESEGCLVHRMNDYIRVQLKEEVSFRDFKAWKEKIENIIDLKTQIMSFSLSTKTPMDAFEFIRNIQTDLQTNLIIPN